MYNLFKKYANKGMRNGDFVIDCQLDYKTREVIFTFDKYQKSVKVSKKDFDLLAENEGDFVDFVLNSI